MAATAVPDLALRGGDTVTELQRALNNHYGGDFAQATPGLPTPAFASSNDLLSGNPIDIPIDTEASHNDTEVHDNTTQLGSHNATELASPDFDFGFGDVVIGDKNSASGDRAVAISGTAPGDILTGDGNEAYIGDIQTGSNSNIAYGNGTGVIQEDLDQHLDTDTELPGSALPNYTALPSVTGTQPEHGEASDQTPVAAPATFDDDWSGASADPDQYPAPPNTAFDLSD